jgi:uncharacterized protein
MNKIRLLIGVLILCSSFVMSKEPVEKIRFFNLNEVRLLPGRFYDNMKRDSAWMVSIPVNSLLHSFRNNAGVYSGTEGGYSSTSKMGGWESLDCDLRGHSTGHLLSAYALMYASTGSNVFKLKGDSVVDGLADVQKKLGNSGYLSAFPEELINRCIEGKPVWAPWYTLHKILAGLIDQYCYADNKKALAIATKMGEWAYFKVSVLDSASLHRMIRNEYGGVNESFYNLYKITRNKRFFQLAEMFYKADNIDPLKNRQDKLGTLHANTFIPKVIAEACKYELTGDYASRKAAEYFQQLIDTKYSYITGEIGDREHFFNPNMMSKHLSGYAGETCCTYNELKLCRHIFSWNADPKVMDYYERALFNQILGQQDTQSGMVCYFTPLLTGAYKMYSTPNNSYWCCVGTGFENHARYTESIYSHDDNGVYVNLFIPSVLNWNEKGISIKQTTNFPKQGIINMEITKSPSLAWTIYLRYPEWAKRLSIKINNRPFVVRQSAGRYIQIKRKWEKGDVIEASYGMQIETVPCADNPHCVALKYGPIVLAGELGTANMTPPAPFSNPALHNDYYTYDYRIPEGLNTSLSKLDIKALKRSSDTLKFVTKGGIIIKPLYDIYHERYVVYWTMK